MSLIVVTAFSTKDAAQAARMLDFCADLSGQQPNTIVLAHEADVPAQDVRRAATRAFAKVEHLPVRSSFDAWPGSANDYFAITASAMRGKSPWLWLEADCVPMCPEWLEALEGEYARVGKPCLGTIIPSFRSRHGVWEEIGKMLAGVAIYHPNIWDASPLLQHLLTTNNEYARAKALPRAFDSYLANELLRVSGTTALIQHMGRSREFRRENGRIVCSYGPESRWSPVVASETALVHGCKDESLIDLLRAEGWRPAAKLTAPPKAVESPIEFPKQEPEPKGWGTSWYLPPERPPAVPPPVPKEVTAKLEPIEPPTVRPQASPESVASLEAAMESVEHWPECQQRTFSLASKLGRYRVACQCGASSPKLSEGVDWEAAWEQRASEPKIEIDAEPTESKAAAASGEWDSTHSHKVSPVGSTPTSGTTLKDQPGGAGASPAEFAGSRGVKKHPESPGAEEQKPAIPPAEGEVPAGPQLSRKQRRRRELQANKKRRDQIREAIVRELRVKSKRILTRAASARMRQLEKIGTGYQGAFMKLRRHAEKVGVKNAKDFNKDQLLILILEKEIEQPWEEFAKA